MVKGADEERGGKATAEGRSAALKVSLLWLLQPAAVLMGRFFCLLHCRKGDHGPGAHHGPHSAGHRVLIWVRVYSGIWPVEVWQRSDPFLA